MKTFKEKFTAWLDGALSAEESLAFEKEHPSLQEERRELMKHIKTFEEKFTAWLDGKALSKEEAVAFKKFRFRMQAISPFLLEARLTKQKFFRKLSLSLSLSL